MRSRATRGLSPNSVISGKELLVDSISSDGHVGASHPALGPLAATGRRSYQHTAEPNVITHSCWPALMPGPAGISTFSDHLVNPA